MTDKNELKILGYKQRMGQVTSEYEDRIIDIRVDLTLEIQRMNEEIQRLNSENQRLRDLLEENDVAIPTEG
ncbi:hypothetical protein HUN41_00068 [Streptomyces phage Coruscant]|uniref:Uncharacterized protein n=1 Tax=Streptomyces phage Coruscant TaxID=2739834 RepID=A0A7G4AW07_9CAUD|nr:hypothetical protein PP454_gp220 [Streptomyces phage Coruscant]QMP84197.1 hypothetical protein HUN41_00068 [Streptomyces phage Coruscant]